MELFLLRGTSFVESVADGFVQDCSHVSREGEQNRKQCFWNRNTKQKRRQNSLVKQRNIRHPEKFMISMDTLNPSVLRRIPR